MSNSERVQELKDFIKHYCIPCKTGESFEELWYERAIKLGIFEGVAPISKFDEKRIGECLSILTPKKNG